jgi:CheY-like chemotaxis protein
MHRVLVAEDDLVIRRLYVIWLESAGYDVVDVADGRAAIELLDHGTLPDAAVLDVDMPYVDGLSVCRYLHARDPEMAIVIATGTVGAEREAYASGASALLTKPCSREELLQALSAAERPAAAA